MVDAQNFCLCIYHSNLEYPSSSIPQSYRKFSAVTLRDPEVTFTDSVPKLAETHGKIILWNFWELLTKPRSKKLKV